MSNPYMISIYDQRILWDVTGLHIHCCLHHSLLAVRLQLSFPACSQGFSIAPVIMCHCHSEGCITFISQPCEGL